MFYNDFESAFDEAYEDYKFKRFMQGYKMYQCIKWGLLAVLLGAVALVVFLIKGEEDLSSNMIVVVLLGIILTGLYLIFYPRYAKGSRGERKNRAFNDLLSNVLNGCFDNEIRVSETNLSRADYERSCPEQRYRDFETASFYIDDIGITVKNSEAEIKICGMSVLEAGSNRIEIYNDTLMTGMIFAAAQFSDRSSLDPENSRIKSFLDKRSEKIFVSAYEDTLYIEIDYKNISINGVSKKRLQRCCRDVCENVALILEIVDRI